MDNDTPRTNAWQKAYNSGGPDAPTILDFMRQLERELQQALRTGPNGNSDTARLNWMESHRATVYRSDEALHWVVVDETLSSRKGNVKKTLREAIDAAMPTATPCQLAPHKE